MNNTGRTAALIRAVLIITGAILITIGILGKEYIPVFNKAVRICLECIGIG